MIELARLISQSGIDITGRENLEIEDLLSELEAKGTLNKEQVTKILEEVDRELNKP